MKYGLCARSDFPDQMSLRSKNRLSWQATLTIEKEPVGSPARWESYRLLYASKERNVDWIVLATWAGAR